MLLELRFQNDHHFFRISKNQRPTKKKRKHQIIFNSFSKEIYIFTHLYFYIIYHMTDKISKNNVYVYNFI